MYPRCADRGACASGVRGRDVSAQRGCTARRSRGDIAPLENRASWSILVDTFRTLRRVGVSDHVTQGLARRRKAPPQGRLLAGRFRHRRERRSCVSGAHRASKFRGVDSSPWWLTNLSGSSSISPMAVCSRASSGRCAPSARRWPSCCTAVRRVLIRSRFSAVYRLPSCSQSVGCRARLRPRAHRHPGAPQLQRKPARRGGPCARMTRVTALAFFHSTCEGPELARSGRTRASPCWPSCEQRLRGSRSAAGAVRWRYRPPYTHCSSIPPRSAKTRQGDLTNPEARPNQKLSAEMRGS